MSECVETDYYGNQLEKLYYKIARQILKNYDIGNDCNSHRTVIMIAQDKYGANLKQAMKIWNIIKNSEFKEVC